MPVSKYHMILILLLVCASCIDPFEPEINEVQKVLVISGMISDTPGTHVVTVSNSTPYNNPFQDPVSGCVVSVEDGAGNVMVYKEQDPGLYSAYLEAPFLAVGKSYSLFVSTPNQQEYRSDYDTLLSCPPIDSLYFEVQSQGTADPNLTYHGLQFFNDVIGTQDGARNFRWLANETWQYHSPYISDYIWYGEQLIPVREDTISNCYMNDPVKSIFSASTRSLSENRLKRNSLHYVSNQSPRLSLKYSLLLEQQSLTDMAFSYWDHLRVQAGEGGGLYETQPSSTVGNIYNINRPEEKVLGYFYATQVQYKRITIKNEFEFDVNRFRCILDTVQTLEDVMGGGGAFPYYILRLDPTVDGPPYLYGPDQCFDCRIRGGVTEKPEYW